MSHRNEVKSILLPDSVWLFSHKSDNTLKDKKIEIRRYLGFHISIQVCIVLVYTKMCINCKEEKCTFLSDSIKFLLLFENSIKTLNKTKQVAMVVVTIHKDKNCSLLSVFLTQRLIKTMFLVGGGHQHFILFSFSESFLLDFFNSILIPLSFFQFGFFVPCSHHSKCFSIWFLFFLNLFIPA